MDTKTKEELHHEPDQPESDAGDNGGFIETPNRRSWGREYSPSQPAGDGSEQSGGSRRALGKSFADIAAGNAGGQHPAIERIISKHPERYVPDAHSICTPDCPNRRRDPQPDQGPHAAPHPVLISDVRPSTKERLAVLEHQMRDHDRDLMSVHEQVIRASEASATKDDRADLERRIDHVHLRIDREADDIKKDVENQAKAIEKLQTKRWIKDVLVITSLIVSVAGNIIMLYKLFIVP